MGGAISCCWGPRRRPPYLTDDILVEIFLRLPPHPDCLRRLSLVSCRFRRLVTSRRFLRRFRELHGDAPVAPLVGFFQNKHHGEHNCFVPIGVDGASVHRSISRRGHGCPAGVGRPGVLAAGEEDWNVLGSRRGRVLLLSPERLRLLVLEPLLGRRQYILTPAWPDYTPLFFSNAAVVSAAGGHDELRPHLFRVVFIASDAANRRSTAFIYNSVTFRWTKVATAEMSSVIDARPSVLIENVLYWHLISHGIIAFNLETHALHEILVPTDAFDDVHEANLSIVVPKNGGVGLAVVSGYILQIWKLRNYTHGAASWDLRKIVRLDALLPLGDARFKSTANIKDALMWIVAVDEDQNVGYVWTMVGVFAVQLDSMKYHRVLGPVCRAMEIVYPYNSFFVPKGSSAAMII